MHSRDLKKAGESDERLFTVAAWREAPYFTDAETRRAGAHRGRPGRLSDRPNAVPDEIWNEATRHYDEPALAALLIAIATIHSWKPLQCHHSASGRRVGAVMAPENQQDGVEVVVPSKARQIGYWVATGLTAFMFLSGGVADPRPAGPPSWKA